MNYEKPVEIAPGVYWVGYVIQDDPLQCHVYLIDNGSESILIILYSADFEEILLTIFEKMKNYVNNIQSITIINNTVSFTVNEKEIKFLKLKKLNNDLYKKSITDNLTGLYNRNLLFEVLDKKISKSRRYKYPLSIAIIDLDFFKKVNDTYGHLTGDCLLKEFSILLKKNFRSSDIIARYGCE